MFHEKNFTKIQVSNTGIEVFSFSKKLLKKYGKCFLKRQWLQNRLWIFKFENLFDHLLECNTKAPGECSSLGRNIVNAKGKPNAIPKRNLNKSLESF